MATAKPPPLLGGTAIKPVERHGLEAVKYFIHNPETGEIFSRTPKSWGLITTFYVIYYSCLAAFWAICMATFLQTLSYDEPKWQNTGGIIGGSPTLGFIPRQPEHLIDSSIKIRKIVFNKDSNATQGKNSIPNWQGWAERITDFMEVYTNASSKGKGRDCGVNGIKSDKKHGCLFEHTKLGACGLANYGYDNGTPCIFLKLNRIYGLENKAYNETYFPQDMPEDLISVIKNEVDKDQVWVNCEGKYHEDNQLLQKIEYFPSSRGFSNKYFPYLGQHDYLSPLVAVQFHPRLPLAIGETIHIECRAWAHNIIHSRQDKIGITSLELQILDDAATKNITGASN